MSSIDKKKLANWNDRFKEIVWAKSGSFPWWPSYVIDPRRLSPAEEGYDKAQKCIGKKYVVLFYADKTLGFVSPNEMRPFNDESLAEYCKQKIPNKYKNLFPQAVEEATADYHLAPDDRLSWYFVNSLPPFVKGVDYDDNEEASYFEDAAKEEDDILSFNLSDENLDFEFKDDSLVIELNNGDNVEKKKRGRPKGSTNKNLINSNGEEDEGDGYANGPSIKKRGRPKKSSTDSIIMSPSVELSNEFQEEEVITNGKKRGRPKGTMKQSSTEVFKSSSDLEKGSNPVKKRGRPRIHTEVPLNDNADDPKEDITNEEMVEEDNSHEDSEEEEEEEYEESEEVVNKKRRTAGSSILRQNKKSSTSVQPELKEGATSSIKKGQFDEESKLERLTRLANILQISIAPNCFDLKRALKTFHKVNEIENISIEEFLESGIVTAVKAAKRAGNAELRSIAENQLDTWKKKTQAIKDTAANNSSSAKSAEINLKKSNSSSKLTELPISAAFTLERTRALRMLNDVLSNQAYVKRLEMVLFSLYGDSGLVRYFESISRIYHGIRTNVLCSSDVEMYLDRIEHADDPKSVDPPFNWYIEKVNT